MVDEPGPGPGSWVLDTTHFTGPVTRFTREVFAAPVERGFRDGTRPYGILLDHIAWGFLDHWPYLSPRPVAEAEGAVDLTADDWHRRVASSPALAERLATAERVFPTKAWRTDLVAWDREVKPAAIREHEQLARTDPDRLGAGELAAYLERCRENLQWSLYRHHRLNVAAVIAVGDFCVHVEGWTGRSGSEVLGVLSGATPLFLGAGDELAGVVAAVRADPEALAVLAAGTAAGGQVPQAVIAKLRRGRGATGEAVARYLGRVGDWPVGSGADVADPRLVEMPELLVRTLAAAVVGPAQAGATDAPAADLRRAVPPGERATFDELLAEAKDSYRLRDERATFCDVWAFGLMRRAMLSAGGRLAGQGLIAEPLDVLEAGAAELGDLVSGHRGVDGDELRARARQRAEARWADAPPFLGPPPRAPVPVAWLPPAAARTERAFRAYVGAMAAGDEDPADPGPSGPAERETPGDAGPVRGVAASPGRHDGRARIVSGADELARVEDGDVLVAPATSPAFNVVLPFVGAIVTDLGGVLSHAAIVAREYGIPAVVGTGDATRRIPDGARVRVDGDSGEVHRLA